jgi:G3E family GTPase
MSTTSKKHPVTIITGFLGAGKTTYLNHLINSNPRTRYAIIENEFGEQGVDGELILRPDNNIVELNNGCLCCTLNNNLYNILNDLYSRKDEFDEVIIEATGVADPSGLAEPFIVHPAVKNTFPLKGLICLVDAKLIENYLSETEEAKMQISYSDIILINKIDLIKKEYLEYLGEMLRLLNPIAKVCIGNKGNFPIIHFDHIESPLDKLFQLHNQAVIMSHINPQRPISKSHTHHHHEHTKEINSQTFVFDTPFDPLYLEHRLMTYMKLQSADLYRMKGLVWIEGSKDMFIIQSAGKQIEYERHRAWKPDEVKKSIIVFIGKSIQRNGLEKLLFQCLSKKYVV